MPSYRDWKRQMARKAQEGRFPLTLECELTSACPFRCPMCYAREDHPRNERSTSEWKAFFDAALQAGVLFFILTGGEPLSRPDFWELYEYLSQKGVRITVFTNGSLIDAKAIRRFRDNPPELIAITLYGWDPESAERVTRLPDAFARVDKAIDLLTEAGLPFALRTLPIRPIYQGLERMIDYVRSKNRFLGYQLYIAPSKDVRNPLSLRLKPKELARFEWMVCHAFSEYEQEDCAAGTRSGRCQALVTGAFLGHDGFLRPCALAEEPKEVLDPSRFLEIYRSLGERWKALTAKSRCEGCGRRSTCLECPARNRLEGDPDGCPEYMMACAKARGGEPDADL